MAVCLRSFFACQRFLASENDVYEFANTFCHLGPDSALKQHIAYKIQHNASTLVTYLTVTNNNFEYLRYDYLLYFNAHVTDLLLLPLF